MRERVRQKRIQTYCRKTDRGRGKDRERERERQSNTQRERNGVRERKREKERERDKVIDGERAWVMFTVRDKVCVFVRTESWDLPVTFHLSNLLAFPGTSLLPRLLRSVTRKGGLMALHVP